jgi:hypothetical protein
MNQAERWKKRMIFIISAFYGVSRCQASEIHVTFSMLQIELILITASPASHHRRPPNCSRAPAVQSADV